MLKRVMLLCAGVLLISQAGLQAQVDLSPQIEQIRQEKLGIAENELREYLKVKQKNADEIHYWLGVIKYKQQAFDQAKKSFENGLATRSKSALNLAGMGLMKMIEQNFTEAYEFLTKAMEVSKGKDPEVAYAVADAYLQGGPAEIAEAKKILYKRREDDSEDPRTYQMLGEYYLKQGVPELAMEELKNAIAKDDSFVPGYVGLAQLHYDQGKETRSGEDFKQGYDYVNKAIELKPNFGPAYRVRAELFLISQAPNKYERARDDIQKFLELQGNEVAARIRYAEFLFLTEDYEKALTEINSLEEAGATTNVLRRLKGMSLANLNDLEGAQKAMKEYFDKVDEKYRISLDYEVYGNVLRKQGNFEEADKYYVEAINRSEDRDGLFTEIADSYQQAAKEVEAASREIKNSAREQEALAKAAFDKYNECARAGDADCAAAQKAAMDAAVEEGKNLLAQADEKEEMAIPEYKNEAHYRRLALKYADPVTLTLHRDLGIALYKAKLYEEADMAFKETSKLKADYMTPYKYRMQCAYYLEQKDPESNEWFAKPVAEDVIQVYGEQVASLDQSDQQTVLVAFEVMANYNFNPTGEEGNYHCDDARPWIDRIQAVDADYARIKPIADYCDQVSGGN